MLQDEKQPAEESRGHVSPDGPNAGTLGERLVSAWQRIPTRFKKAFTLTLGVNLLVFAYLLLHHPLGNHDLSRLPWIEYLNQVSVGRWFCFFIYMLVGHAQLPVLNQLLAIVLHVLTGMAVAVYWKRGAHVFPLTVAALMASLIPFVLSHFYYSYQSLCFGAAQLLAIGGLMAAARATRAGVSLGAVLMLFALASYQPVLNVATVALLLYTLLMLSDRRVRDQSLAPGRFIRTIFAPGAIAIVAGGVLYRISLILIQQLGWVEWNAYQLHEASWSHLPQRIVRSLEAALTHLVLPQPYMLLPVKLILLALLVMAAWVVLRRLGGARPGRRSYATAGLLLLIGAIWATKTICLISEIGFHFAFRLSGGLTCLYIFAVLLAMESSGARRRSIAAVLTTGTLLLFVHQDLIHQSLRVRNNEHDLHLANRILTRIEGVRELDPDKTYNLIVIGDFPHYGIERYRERAGSFRRPADYMDDHSMVPPWKPELVFSMIGSSLSLKTPWKDQDQDLLRQRAYLYALQHDAWPAKQSVGLLEDEKLVVVVLEGDVVELAKGYTRLARRLLRMDAPDTARTATLHEEINEQLGYLYARQERRVRGKLDWLERKLTAARDEGQATAAAGARPSAAAERLFRESEEGLHLARRMLESANTNETAAVRLEMLQKLSNNLAELQRIIWKVRKHVRPGSRS